jgi:hypothetical protein
VPPRDLVDDWDNGSHELVSRGGGTNLADILERVLDKGVVVAGDIVVSLVDVELLTIRLRLLIASVDKAKEMGIDWWEHDPWLSAGARDGNGAGGDGEGSDGGGGLDERMARLEQAVDRLSSALESGGRPRAAGGSAKQAASKAPAGRGRG